MKYRYEVHYGHNSIYLANSLSDALAYARHELKQGRNVSIVVI